MAAFLYIQKFKPQDIPLYDTAKRGLGEPDVALHLRVQDISRQSQTWGTEVPIVRESEARTEVHLVDIPTSSAFRKKIRVFDFSGLNGLQMQATITDMATGSILAKKDLTLSGATFNGAGYPLTPASSQFDLTSTDFTRLPETERVSVTILPKTFALVRYWGYATIVNNETQHITLITPQ
ncbi:MAG TPA: hypothetical protein VNM92_03545 [Thermoanaerobaculia bacterium]|nr:hypothetical protein [Thermoanaerobaculia bacterium]